MAKTTVHNNAYVPMSNKFNVMRLIISEGPINRAAIARKTGITIPSVMAITDDLIGCGLVCSAGKGDSCGGKRPELLAVVSDSVYFVGVDIGRDMTRLVIQDFSAKIIFGSREKTGVVFPEEAFIDRLSRLILKCIDEAEIDKSRIAGVGIAMPGLIGQENGCVMFSPDFGWRDIPLQQSLSKKLPYPVLVENANRALALAESDGLLAEGVLDRHTTLCVNLGHGIGAALVQNGRLYYGSSGTSGEIGHITVNKDGPLCSCGNSGCLEAVASGEAIARQARDAIQSKVSTTLLQKAGSLEEIDAKVVFDAALEGDAVAVSIIDRAAEYIGIGIAMAVNLLDPDKVILCGGLTKNGKPFFDKVNESFEKHRMRQAGRCVMLSLGKKGDYSTAIGAAEIIFYNAHKIPMLEHL